MRDLGIPKEKDRWSGGGHKSESCCSMFYLETPQEVRNPLVLVKLWNIIFRWRKRWYITSTNFRDMIFDILGAQFSRIIFPFENMKNWKVKKWKGFSFVTHWDLGMKKEITGKKQWKLLEFWRIFLKTNFNTKASTKRKIMKLNGSPHGYFHSTFRFYFWPTPWRWRSFFKNILHNSKSLRFLFPLSSFFEPRYLESKKRKWKEKKSEKSYFHQK